jgi:hypothetical protein
MEAADRRRAREEIELPGTVDEQDVPDEPLALEEVIDH